jgi:hypothetical protein
MRQLQLGLFVDSLHQLSPGHRSAAQALLDKVFASRKGPLDRLLVAICQDPSFEVLAGANLDYRVLNGLYRPQTVSVKVQPLLN